MKNIKQMKEEGFTLIELLVVVAIIAILALVVLLAINPVEMARRSRDSRRLSDVGTLRRAIDLSLADGETLPTCGATTVNSTVTAAAFGCGAPNTMNIGKYLSAVPEDPYHGTGNPQTVLDGSGACTTTTGVMPAYTFWSDGSTYELNSYVESKDNCKAVVTDGGNSAAKYELGTNPGLAGM